MTLLRQTSQRPYTVVGWKKVPLVCTVVAANKAEAIAKAKSEQWETGTDYTMMAEGELRITDVIRDE